MREISNQVHYFSSTDEEGEKMGEWKGLDVDINFPL